MEKSAALKGLQDGKQDDNKALATEALKFLQDYRTAAQPVLNQIEAGGFTPADRNVFRVWLSRQ